MARAREPADWGRDLAGARPIEAQVAAALRLHPQVSHLADLTAEMDALDFRFRFERLEVHLDVKAKFRPLSDDYAEQWPEVARDDLFVLDETSFRTLVWTEGLGYLLVDDVTRRRWHVLGPWELCLGPRRRFERRGDRGAGAFLKGKLLLDLRSAAASGPRCDIDQLLDVVRESRRALHRVRYVHIRSEGDLPVIPRPAEEPRPAVGPGPAPPADGAADRRWAGLDPALAQAVRERWGWHEPTAVQRLAFPPVLLGRNVLILAPTAGGKTEAALLPLLDLHRRRGWGTGRPSILAISPLKALLDDQLARWRNATSLVGASAFAWHGDVGGDARNAFKDEPADALLTTPESLEVLLSSPSHDEQRLFAGLRAVVIDEVHAFVGTPRGAQLASLLERLGRFVDADLQRIGLSATVANPEEVLEWLQGGSLRESEVVKAGSTMQGEDVSVRTYSNAEAALPVITGAAHGHRCLVFTRSRRRAEELAQLLGAPVHHSSVSAEDRAETVRRLKGRSVDCVVATASLEMGWTSGTSIWWSTTALRRRPVATSSASGAAVERRAHGGGWSSPPGKPTTSCSCSPSSLASGATTSTRCRRGGAPASCWASRRSRSPCSRSSPITTGSTRPCAGAPPSPASTTTSTSPSSTCSPTIGSEATATGWCSAPRDNAATEGPEE